MGVKWKHRDIGQPEDRVLRLFIDADVDKGVPYQVELTKEQTLSLVVADVKYLHSKHDLGRAEIYESGGGFMVRFPQSTLSPKELVLILRDSMAVDPGYAYWAIEWGGIQTLRESEKKIVEVGEDGKETTRSEGETPELIKIIFQEEKRG